MGIIRDLKTIFSWWAPGMEPTGVQCEDTFTSFYHKEEDAIPLDAVDGLTDELNKKYTKDEGRELEGRVAATEGRLDGHDGQIENIYKEIADHEDRLDGHDDHFETVEEDLEALRQADTSIRTEIEGLHRTDTGLRDDLTSAQTDISTIRDMLKGGGTLAQAKAALIALGANYQDVYEIASTLKAFLKASDTADTTINTWKEIEHFLEGITDTDSLTLLLEQLEVKITAAYKEYTNSAVAVEKERAQAAERAVSAEVATEKSRAESAETALGDRITGVRGELRQADTEIKQDLSAVKQTILAMQADSAGRVIPLQVDLEYPKKITARNPVAQRFVTRLLPSFALQNVLYLGDGKAVDVEPDGAIIPLELGKSRVHIIPTENTALHKTVTIEVVEPSIIKASTTKMLLTGSGGILLT